MRARLAIPLVALLATRAAAGLDAVDVAQCDALVREQPNRIESFLCYYLAAREHGQWDAAIASLEARLDAEPQDPRAQLYLGRLVAERGAGERAEKLFGASAEGFAGEGDLRGEVWARESLAINLDYRREPARAQEQYDLALALARSADDPLLRAEVEVAMAWSKNRRFEHGSAWTLYRKAAAVILPDGPDHLKSRVLDGLASAAWSLGLFEEAFEAYGELLDLVGRGEDAATEAMVRTNLALVARGLVHHGLMSDEELLRLKRDALDAALRSGSRSAEAVARLLLAEALLEHEALLHAERALALARELGRPGTLDWARWVLAEKLLALRPERAAEAFRLVDESERRCERFGDLEGMTRSRLVRSVMHWQLGERERAIADGLDALDGVERIRDLQLDREAQARVFSRFAHAYRRLAGYLLTPASGKPTPEDLDAAFRVLERLRARALLDRMDAVGATEALTPAGAATARRAEILQAIVGVQRSLMDPGADDRAREALLVRLEGLEAEERAVRERIARSDPAFRAIRVPMLPAVRHVQRALEPDQALVSYQIARPDRGGSWAFVLTHARAQAVRLPVERPLDREVLAFVALLERRDGSERPAAQRLRELLLADVLPVLPEEVRRLVVIPDGALHRLPFGTLPLTATGPFLAQRYEVSVAPSHSVWLRWKRQPQSAEAGGLIALADPVLPWAEVESRYRGGPEAGGPLALGPLPHARREARALLGRLGGTGRLLTGKEATEHALKSTDFSRVRVLHLATHAIVDERRPERSAVLLAPGAATEDGLLQVREVVDLPLDGQVVILSACRSGSGPVIGGDGVMGLANAFFLAGSRTVVAGLWPLRDDEASALVARVARGLARGRSVAAAVSEARRELIDRGAPPAAWAGLIVLGDGDRVPLAGGRGSPPFPAIAVALSLGLSVAIVAVSWLARRLRRPTPAD